MARTKAQPKDQTEGELSSLDTYIPTLEELSLADLRLRAQKYYRIPVDRDMDKDMIIAAIRAKESGKNYATVAHGNAPKPGWARIKIHLDPTPGAANLPIPFHINGYDVKIPRGHEVDVPIKVVDGPLADALTMRINEDMSQPLNSRAYFKREMVPTYPYTELMRTPGPDPRPGNEAMRAIKHRPREAFRNKFGYWPSSEELKSAIKDRLIRPDGKETEEDLAQNGGNS